MNKFLVLQKTAWWAGGLHIYHSLVVKLKACNLNICLVMLVNSILHNHSEEESDLYRLAAQLCMALSLLSHT